MIYSKEQLKNLIGFPKKVVNRISEAIDVLDENYGEDRYVRGGIYTYSRKYR